MPKIQSAKKALRQNRRRYTRNRKNKDQIKSVIKQYKKLLASKKQEEAVVYLKTVFKTLDKMAKTKVIKKGKANRFKSRLSKKLK